MASQLKIHITPFPGGVHWCHEQELNWLKKLFSKDSDHPPAYYNYCNTCGGVFYDPTEAFICVNCEKETGQIPVL